MRLFFLLLSACNFGLKTTVEDLDVEFDDEEEENEGVPGGSGSADGDSGGNGSGSSQGGGQGGTQGGGQGGTQGGSGQDTGDWTPSDTGSQSGDGSFTISAITPAYGSSWGGTEVLIEGGPFDSSATVYFDQTPANVLSNNGFAIRVQSPSYPGEGAANITVEDGSGTQTLSAAYVYFEDGTGLAGAVGYMRYMTLTGSYWSGGSLDYGKASVSFLVPADFHWWEFYVPSMDSCAGSTYAYSGSLYAMDFAEPTVYLSRNGNSIPLHWDSSTYSHTSADLTSSDIFGNAQYDLEPFTGPMAGFEVPQIAHTSQAPSLSQPAISGSSPPNIYSNQNFSWTPSGASWVQITLAMLDSSGLGYESQFTCVAQDDGSFSVNTSLLGSWPFQRQIDVYFSRVYEKTVILPHNNSESRIIGEYTLLGAGFSY